MPPAAAGAGGAGAAAAAGACAGAAAGGARAGGAGGAGAGAILVLVSVPLRSCWQSGCPPPPLPSLSSGRPLPHEGQFGLLALSIRSP